MPLDPTIPLGGHPIQAPQQMNPMAMIGQWAQIQQQMNQNKLFQQTFAARQRAGELLSAAPDLESGLQALLKDPITAPFAGETINAARQGQLALTQMQGEIQLQSKAGLDAFAKMLGPVFADPTQETWDNVARATLSTLSPQAQARVAPAIDSLRRSLITGLPEDPAAAKAAFTQRLTGLTLAGGMTPETLKQLTGSNKDQDLGDVIQPGLERPSQLGGGFTPAGAPLAKGLAPTTVTQPGGIPDVLRSPRNSLYPQAPQGATPQATALGGTPPHEHGQLESFEPYQSEIAPPRAPQGVSAQRLPAPPAGRIGDDAGPARPPDDLAAAPPEADALAYDGKPLIPPGYKFSTPLTGKSVGGANILSPAQLKGAEKLMDRFNGDELDAYQNNVASLGALDRMDHALETMAKTGGLLAPGAFGNTRLEVARTMNMLADLISKNTGQDIKSPFDPATIATAEDLRKEATRAGMLFLSQTLGAQREAASVIYSTIQAVPGLDNTLLGGRLVSRSLRAAAQRSIDQRNFQEEWAKRTQGDLSGSVAEFNKLHPGEEYFENVLRSMGMSENGFESPIQIQQAFRNGFLTKDEAAGFLTSQFPDQFKGK